MRRMGVVIKYRSCGKARYNMKTCFRRQAITLKITNKNIIIFQIMKHISCLALYLLNQENVGGMDNLQVHENIGPQQETQFVFESSTQPGKTYTTSS